MKLLTRKQSRFVAEYLAAPNATHAAIRAGFSARSARGVASKLLLLPQVRQALAEGSARLLEKLDLEARDLLREAARVVVVDLSQLIGDDGRPRDLGEIDAGMMAALDVNLSYDKDCHFNGGRLRRLDKLAAITLLGRHHGLFTARVAAIDATEVIEGITEGNRSAR